MMSHLVQIGLFGQVGRFQAIDHRQYSRDSEVVCRTPRGLEIGRVLASDQVSERVAESDGELLRSLSPDDELIVKRIERFRDRAFEACTKLIKERGFSATLVDVEHLFDGQNLFFYFLGDVSPELEELTNELAEAYEAKVKFRKFAEMVASGCGPDCGTGVGCGTNGNCQSCALKGGCQ